MPVRQKVALLRESALAGSDENVSTDKSGGDLDEEKSEGRKSPGPAKQKREASSTSSRQVGSRRTDPATSKVAKASTPSSQKKTENSKPSKLKTGRKMRLLPKSAPSQQLTLEYQSDLPKLVVCESPLHAPPTDNPSQETIDKVDSAVKSLNKLESEVMSALFPTDGTLHQSYEVIAARLGMSVEEVRGVADNALRGLRGIRAPGGRVSSVWN